MCLKDAMLGSRWLFSFPTCFSTTDDCLLKSDLRVQLCRSHRIDFWCIPKKETPLRQCQLRFALWPSSTKLLISPSLTLQASSEVQLHLQSPISFAQMKTAPKQGGSFTHSPCHLSFCFENEYGEFPSHPVAKLRPELVTTQGMTHWRKLHARKMPQLFSKLINNHCCLFSLCCSC